MSSLLDFDLLRKSLQTKNGWIECAHPSPLSLEQECPAEFLYTFFCDFFTSRSGQFSLFQPETALNLGVHS